MRTARWLGALAVLGLGLAPAAAADEPTSCVTCHAQLADEPSAVWDQDVHRAAGFGCEACHGGDPSPGLAEDADAAMSARAGYRPPPGRLEVADFCARCHADADFMKKYNPQARVDQLAEYRTSVHGKRNAAGDPGPATCTDCHGAHGVLPVTSPRSPVHATHVPGTCAVCHADAARMAAYGLPTGQYDDFRAGVHGMMLLEAGEAAAPACNDCHGNHGAAPPGLRSVAFVCGQCHGREAALFRASFKKDLFDEAEVGECTVCHGAHRIQHPTPELFHGPTAPTVTGGTLVAAAPLEVAFGDLPAGGRGEATWIAVLRPHLGAADVRLAHAVEVVSEGRDPIVLDATVRPGDDPSPPRREEDDGLAATLTIEPTTGWPLQEGDAVRFRLEVEATDGVPGVAVRDRPGPGLDPLPGSICLACHSPGDACDVASERMYEALITLERDLKGAGAVLRRAELSGMEVRGPQFALKSGGRTAAVEAKALIHAFDPERLVARSEEGKEVAAEALAAGQGALAELQFRRKGLGVSLVLIVLVLLGLGLKIRQIDRARAARP